MKWFKHSISIATLASLAVLLYAGGTIDKTRTIHSSLFFVYSAFTFFTLIMYRVSLIGRVSIKWPTFVLTLLILIGLTAMLNDKELIYSLWNISLAGFILLSGDAVFQITPKDELTLISKIATSILLVLLLGIVAFGIGSPTVFFFTEFLLMLVTLLLIANFFMKKKRI